MKILLNREIHFKIYVLVLMLAAGSITLSNFMISVSIFSLALVWLLGGNYISRIKLLAKNKPFLIYSLLYFCHIFWLFNTHDFKWGFHDARIKLPLLVFPFFIASSPRLSLNHLKYILLTFILGVTINSLISTSVFLFFDKAYYNIREISLFISHIRFSLMIVISIGILAYFIFSTEIKKNKVEKIIYIITFLWLIFFLFLLRSFTGIFIFMILIVPILLKIKSYVKKKHVSRVINSFTVVFFIILIFNLVYPAYLYFRNMESNEGPAKLKFTENGNIYFHNVKNSDRENGFLLWSNLCEKELQNEWEKRSGVGYHEKDGMGHPVKYTLIRYLTSKGLKKDSTGVSKLTAEDISLVENGVANYIYGKKLSFYPRVYELIWELDRYIKGNNPSGHSFTQRIEFVKNGLAIVKNNFLLGVGTGDVVQAINNQFNISHSKLKQKSRLKTHNQYVTFFISFGLIGFIIVMISFFYPIYLKRSNQLLISYITFTVLFLSMINEDTLESHVGVSLFSFMYAIFVFGYNGNKSNTAVSQSITNFRKFLKILF